MLEPSKLVHARLVDRQPLFDTPCELYGWLLKMIVTLVYVVLMYKRSVEGCIKIALPHTKETRHKDGSTQVRPGMYTSNPTFFLIISSSGYVFKLVETALHLQ